MGRGGAGGDRARRGDPARSESSGAGRRGGTMSELRRILEAILFVCDEPIDAGILAQVTEEPKDRIGGELRALASDLDAQNRGVALREVAGGWRLYTHPDAAAYVERFVRSVQQPRLTQ